MNRMQSLIPDWWAVEAMIASQNHVYQVALRTHYEETGVIGICDYSDTGANPSYQIEFLALNPEPQLVIDTVRAYPREANQKYVLKVFHAEPSDPELKEKYLDRGYVFRHAGLFLALNLPVIVRTRWPNIYRIKTKDQLDFANTDLAAEGQHISESLLDDPFVHTFYVDQDGHTVGWAQLVTIYPGVGCLHQLFTMSAFRRQGIGNALMEHIHGEAMTQGLTHIVLNPTDISMRIFRRQGYQPAAYFSAFEPREQIDLSKQETLKKPT